MPCANCADGSRTCRWTAAFNVRVNISTTELQNLELIEHVRDILRETGVDASNLIVELTESMAVNGGDVDQYSLNGLRRLGVQLEIDDFGTGYSSISYLRKLPVNVVKIDRSLISGLGADEQQRNFVAAVLHLIHACGLKALAEGIETAEQAEVLARMGCGSGQGYYFGRPAPAGEIVALIGLDSSSAGWTLGGACLAGLVFSRRDAV